MGKMINAVLGFDIALRAYLNRAGNSAAAKHLAQAGAALRRVAAEQALDDAVQARDPKLTFEQLVELAVAAGVPWQDMAAIVNRAHERNPGV